MGAARPLAALLLALAGPTALAASTSHPMRVSVRVVRSISARAPDLLPLAAQELRAPSATAAPSGARFSVQARGHREQPAVFAGVAGEPPRRCLDSQCISPAPRAAGGGADAIVVTLFPDGAPAAIVER